MTEEEKIICKDFLNDADKTHSCNEYKLLMDLLEQEPTTKNDLAVDCRSLKDIKKLVERKADDLDGVMLDAGGVIIGLYFAIANDLPSVTPQEPKSEWEHDHAILKAYSDGANDVLDKVRAEIEQAEFALDKSLDFQDDRTDTEKFVDWSRIFKVIMCEIIDKYKGESEG